MKWITAWRRRPSAGYAVVVVALATIGFGYAGFSANAEGAQAQASTTADDVAEGKKLFDQSCVTCHGQNGEGVEGQGPSLIGVGAAAVDFQVSSGRMPARSPGAQIERKEPIFDEEQTRQLAAYIASLGGGPAVPSADQVDPEKGDPALGQHLFMTNCAQCHNFAGSGGALTGGKSAPSLHSSDVTPTQMYEAMVTGPQAMPVFNDQTMTPEEKRAVIAYIVDTRQEPNPGGVGLGRIGPVTEGLAGWMIGIPLMILAAIWVTAKKKKRQND